ncbi:MAG: DUF177 domain-containing protein [Rhodoferax sp.]|jgi:uncharacterized protein|uniref:YceD family protein n=1 Tax=Rhodoferax sp. TaxID=50421 RepID=UPI001B7C7D5D|nr:YceD family protein [Rhodoferax sp.]MBP8286062.1 DUF177 domain-containing protein [Rhodoferax sp.]MBP9147579.1 DUF177 domain-containing protein [Rhodoferax sp.]MBP9736420.1 DUF177 domain-containing protein [Rhodoferax sp.]
MKDHTLPPRLDIRHAAQADTRLEGQLPIKKWERLSAESNGQGLDQPVYWSAHVTNREGETGQAEPWLQLQVRAPMVQICQRCLEPVEVAVEIDRSFRFVANEAIAETQDDESDEDLLVISREFDLAALIEDEVLLDLPLISRHDVCPVPVKLAAVDPDFDQSAEKPNPFAQLAQLRQPKQD